MDAYSVKVETGNKEAEGSANDATATLQQMIAGSSALMSPLFLPTSDGSSGLPWVVPQYSMMVLPQSFLSAQGATTSMSDGHVLLAPAASTATAETIKIDRAAAGAVGSSQSVAAILQRRDKNVVNSTVSAQPDLLRQYFVDGSAVNQSQTTYSHAEADLKPPKKPLTPYMTFSKMVWPSVKAANPHLSSVTEIGAVVGAMWRELDPSQKQRYNDQFSREKAVYSEELHSYLKTTGLHASDLIKPKLKKKDPRPPVVVNQHNVPAAVPQATGASVGTPALSAAGQQLIQTLLGLQTGTAQDGLASSAALQQVLSNPSSIQQVLAQMSANGQLFANSDGSISVDGSLLTIQGQPVQLAGDQLSTATSSANAGGDLSATDQSRSWAWHQPTVSTADQLTAAAAAGSAGGVVLYQLPSGATAAGDATAAATATAAQSGSFYIDQYGQVVRHDGPSGSAPSEDVNRSEGHLQLQVLQLQAALAEKSREVDDLRQKLSDAYSSLERLKNENEASVSTGPNGSSGDEQFAASAAVSASVAATSETGAVATAVTVVSPSTPS